MSPRQMLRAFEVRAPESPRVLGQQTDKQVRQYPDAAGNYPRDASLDEHLDVTASRIRLNAGALDWRQGPSAAQGGGGSASAQTTEVPVGVQDGVNLDYHTSAKFVPQPLRLYVNGLRQQVSVLGDADFTVGESAGAGTGFDTITLAWAPLPQDQMVVDYQQIDDQGDAP